MPRHRSTTRLLLLASCVALPGAAPPPAVPAYRQFGRWLVACDNTRNCVARGFDEVTRAQLQLSRPAGDATPTLALSAADPFDPAALRLDGKPLALPSPAWSKDATAASTQDLEAVDAFIAAVRNGHALTLDATPSNGDGPCTVPLDGFTAALLLVDAVQGRPDTPSALVAARGTAAPPPASTPPPTPRWAAPPPLTRAETDRLLKEAVRLRSPGFDACNVKDAPEIHALDAANALAIRPCYMAAYQGSSVVAVLPRAGGPARPLTLVLPGVPGSDGRGIATDGPDMVDPGFDPATGTLSTAAKGRGLADCGSSESWVWSDGAFRLKSLSFQDQCGGVEPGDWPTLFRTR